MYSAIQGKRLSQLTLDYARGDVLADKYEIVERLDEGPLGVTYRARHTKHGTYVRLLMLDPKVAGRDRKDAIIEAFKLARSLDHKNLLSMGELGQHAGVAFVTMEDFEGESLRDLMSRYRTANQPFTLREAAQIVIGTLDAAAAVHAAGHTFRALRPENILVAQRRAGPGGKNVVLDVRVIGGGLMNLVEPGDLAEDEYTRGDASYLAPELKGLAPEPTPQSDVYSAGVIFYELLVGSPPVGTYQLPRQRRPDLPSHVDDVVELALAPAPEDRYPTAPDFAADIQRSFTSVDEDDIEMPTGVSWVIVALATAAILAVVMIVYQSNASDPFQLALDQDNALRKQVYEGHTKPDPGEVRDILANHPPNMMYVPAGPFISGRLAHEPNEMGGKRASVTELDGYLIDVFEYPNLRNAPPQINVTWKDAYEMCETAGKRLCSADELEKACRGPENYVYSYGDTYDPDFCGAGLDDVHPAGAYPECKSSWGVYDISGNFREWTSTSRGQGRYLVKGGLPQSNEKGSRCAFSTDLSAVFGDETIGFRCCRDADAPAWEPPAEPEADDE